MGFLGDWHQTSATLVGTKCVICIASRVLERRPNVMHAMQLPYETKLEIYFVGFFNEPQAIFCS